MSAILPDDCFLHDRDRLRHDAALALIHERLRSVVGEETVPLEGAAGRVLARPVTAPRPIPAHDNAAVDGFAYTHASGRSLPVAMRVVAGDAPGALPPGTAARIFTGAPMPDGADTVAMQEDCADEASGRGNADGAGRVRLPEIKRGANVRRAGEDVATGGEVAGAGTRLRPQDLAAIASTGTDTVRVAKRLRVALLSNGDELIAPGAAHRPGGVYDSNRPMLAAMLRGWGCEVADGGLLPDDRGAVTRAVADAAAASDVVVTSGGASKGEEDHVLAVLDALGRRHLWQLAVKPGRPMMMGQIGDTVVLGLPGNPVAAFVCTLLYLRAALDRLGGARHVAPRRYPLPAAFSIHSKPDRREFLRGRIGPDGHVEKFGRDGSGLISGLRWGEGLIEVPEATTRVEEGEPVPFIPFAEFGLST